MKKLILGLMIVALLSLGVTAFADNTQLNDNKYLIVNNTGDKLFTAIPTTVIDKSKHRILRFKVGSIPPGGTSGLSTETVAALYDATTLGAANNKVMEGEIESNDADSVQEKYERPLTLLNGVVIGQGAYTVTLVEWEYRY